MMTGIGIQVRSHKTCKFCVLGPIEDNVGPVVLVNKPSFYKQRQQASSLPQSSSSLPSKHKHKSTAAADYTNVVAGKKISVFLDVNEPYTQELIRTSFQHPARAPHFTVTEGPGHHGMDAVPLPQGCDFQWSEYERIDWDAVLAGKHGASSYCIRKGLSRKAQLAHYSHRHVCKHPNSILRGALPQTLILDTWYVWEDDDPHQNKQSTAAAEGMADIIASQGYNNSTSADSVNQRKKLDRCLRKAKEVMQQAEDEFDERNSTYTTDPPMWILKPSSINKGAGIQIIHIYEQLVDICWSEPDIREWVLQRYVASPLLLRRRKFHIRAYVLAVGALRVYFCQNCLALCSGTRYQKSDPTNLFAHITNTAYQDLDPNFNEDQCVLLWDHNDIAPILLKDGTCKTMQEAKEKIDLVITEMEAITSELFRAYQNEFSVFAPLEECFEHYGFDFLVDDQWRVSLLEVNPGPDFKMTGERLQFVVEDLMGDTIDAALLPKLTQSSQSSCPPLQRIGALNKVYEYQMRSEAAARAGGGVNMKVS